MRGLDRFNKCMNLLSRPLVAKRRSVRASVNHEGEGGGTRNLVRCLSRRERQVLQGLLRGLGEKAVAAELEISRHTVHVYVKAIYRKFGVMSRSELLAKFVVLQVVKDGADSTMVALSSQCLCCKSWSLNDKRKCEHKFRGAVHNEQII